MCIHGEVSISRKIQKGWDDLGLPAGFESWVRIFRFLFFAENLFVDESSSITVSSEVNAATIFLGNYGPIWTLMALKTSSEFRVRFTFEELCFPVTNHFIHIGDGLVQSTDTELARFSGYSLPSEVTSLSHAAWIIINYPTDTFLRFQLTITAVTFDSGNFFVYPCFPQIPTESIRSA